MGCAGGEEGWRCGWTSLLIFILATPAEEKKEEEEKLSSERKGRWVGRIDQSLRCCRNDEQLFETDSKSREGSKLTSKATIAPMTMPAMAPPDKPRRDELAKPATEAELLGVAIVDEEEGERAGRTYPQVPTFVLDA